MPRIRARIRTGASILATGALMMGGLLAGSGQAQAATTIHCADLVVFSFQNCDPFTDTGGPYTLSVNTYWNWNPIPSGTMHLYVAGTNMRTTCQGLTSISQGYYYGTDCTPLAPQ
ncbi:hypothetical protein ACPXCE_27180 [Streptomyces sp. DT24]|uniref:hypothetical protein n=1 Tax=Streptomyces sp. DT24 TaxID=3416520 RepID=UPI003CF2C3F7